jgi:hypothetical protein
VPEYVPVLLSAEMNDYGYWVVTWSVRPALRLPVTCTRVGISRSEAVEATRGILGELYREREGR